jgi:hypothetical protein
MTSFAYGLGGLLLFTMLAPAMQAIARRAGSSIAPITLLAIAAVISHVVSVTIGAISMQQFQYWNAASVFGFGTMLYVFAFGAVYKSVSLEILLDLARRPGGAAELADIVDRKVPEIFRGRTEILVSSGQVESTGSTFAVTAAGRAIAGRIARIRRAFAIGDTGLYDFGAPVKATEKSRHP